MSNKNITITILFFMSAVSTHDCQGMLTHMRYRPFAYVGTKEHEAKRENVFGRIDRYKEDENITVIQELPYHCRGVCADWALNELIPGIDTLEIPFSFAWEWGSHIVNTYCKQNAFPKEKDLAVYVKGSHNNHIVHYGIVTHRLTVNAKWSTETCIVNSHLFDIPLKYGKAVYFFRLRKKFRNDQFSVLSSIKKVIDDNKASIFSLTLLRERQEDFCLKMAELEENSKTIEYEELFNPVSGTFETVASKRGEKSYRKELLITLQKNPHLNLDCRNIKGQTPLIVATRKGAFSVVWILLLYGVQIESKDNRGKTALNYAYNKGHDDIVELLTSKSVSTKSITYKTKRVLSKLLRQKIEKSITPYTCLTIPVLLLYRFGLGFSWSHSFVLLSIAASTGEIFSLIAHVTDKKSMDERW